jgi:alkaline phosphatase
VFFTLLLADPEKPVLEDDLEREYQEIPEDTATVTDLSSSKPPTADTAAKQPAVAAAMESKNGAVSVASNVPSKPQVRSNVMCVIK